MISIPKFKAKYHIEHVEGDGIFLLSENEHHVLEGESLQFIVPLINGKNSWDDISNQVSHVLSKESIQHGFDTLLNNGHVVEHDEYMPDEFAPFWNELGKNSVQVQEMVNNTNIHLKTVGQVNPSHFVDTLGGFGFQLNKDTAPTFMLVIADDYQYDELAPINQYCLDHGIPWLCVKPSGLNPLIGPLFVPGRTACWRCMENRIKHNREVESYIQAKTNAQTPLPLTRSRINMTEMQVASMATMQLVKWLAHGYNPELESRIVSLDIFSLQQHGHYLVRRPQCSACGDPRSAHVAGKPFYLESQITLPESDNGSRLESPEATFNRYAHHISELTGIVKGIFPAHGIGEGILHVYSAGHNFALKNDSLFFLKDGLRSNSSGKGRSPEQARTSALCEAIERFSGLFRGEEEVITSSFEALKDNAVDPRTFMLFSESQYKEREQWLSKGSRFQIVPLPFDEKAEISWSPVWSWTDQTVKYMPTCNLYYGYQDSDATFFGWGDSNGNAAGSSKQDALLQGFLELVERDAVAIWWYNRLTRPQVDLDALNDPYYAQLNTFYQAQNREFWVLDLTTDLGIPAYAAINRRINHNTEDIIMGFGAHLNPKIAINRAITEMNQFMPAVLNTHEDGTTQYTFYDRDAIEWWTTATLENQPYLKPAAKKAPLPKALIDDSLDIKLKLEACFDIVEKLGHEVLILDQTRPDVGLPVVKVIVPGLRHFWARFAPGRLYDVPVKMKWRKSATDEKDLNPIPMFL
ncbi:TOMM precursor leader peptide-binding protein [Aestuariibacter sp. AA17]|uniref:TOMM leader peptide-binding protein n=1 Tax=Fluctibacter corallii TaxID=2984329 RepID=A0ABT3A441_9ALTE|nr:TOMM precursor leader peptide-binding protein [Aestuariibacter sp. AA17]MCV2883418.1 TOMM precursor leader peptide-binding protein [Aestuariibacter sp. AA17]